MTTGNSFLPQRGKEWRYAPEIIQIETKSTKY